MSLKKYNDKRDFEHTPEPAGHARSNKAKHGLVFSVQRHNASHLHYDLRLELDGVLKSWAVPKGPSMNPSDKRLAIMVEDHPSDYALFEGDIPKGNYGAGHVDVWDHGTYVPENGEGKETSVTEMRTGLQKGEVNFCLHGKKLKGSFALIRMKGDEGHWLLIKHRDEFAT